MKKTILLFLFVLPVIIVLLIIAIMGFVGRAVMFRPIQNVTISERIFESSPNFNLQYGTNNLILLASPGEQIEFLRYIIVEPQEAARQLTFESSNPSVVSVDDNGRINVLQNMRTTDPDTGIEIVVTHGADRFFSVFVQVALDDTRFDYFGFDTELFLRGMNNDWEDEFGLSVNFDWQIEIDRDAMQGGNIIPIGMILERGLNIAPNHLLNIANPNRTAFLNSLGFGSSDTSILSITNADGAGQFDASVLATGEVEITITTNFRGAEFSAVVSIVVV